MTRATPYFDKLNSTDLKLRADRANGMLVITLPCSQVRTISTSELDALILRLQEAYHWLKSAPGDNKDF